MFKGRRLLIATKHEKEKTIAPLLEKALGVKCFVAENFDTDMFGTFSGEIERKDKPIDTARNKCLLSMQLHDSDLAIASEGSFGSHPSVFFLQADDEILVLIDLKNNLEIVVRELSIETNFNGSEIRTIKDLHEFANKVNFPSHGLILRKNRNDSEDITKGIKEWEQLDNIFLQLVEKYGVAYIETDMRAMHNPSRMKVIEKATRKLIDKLNSCCPKCKVPGFGITKVKQGLPCKLCHSATRSTLSYIFTCQKCLFTKEEIYPNKKTTENPMYCDFCNP